MRSLRSVLCLLLAVGAWSAGPARGELVIEGATMGTRYTVRVARPGRIAEPELRVAVQGVLDRVDAALSTWRSDSELERFNRSGDTQWVGVSAETARVARAARDLAVRSQGAFDPTVGPLVRLWGFGAEPPAGVPPAAELVAAARAAVGFRRFHVRERPPALRKDLSALELDLSGIAKGHAVDAIATRLIEAGLEHFLVEVGGEVRALGLSSRGGPWAIEIEDPLSAAERTPAIVSLRDAAVATSGPTRNFVVREGVRLPHVFDPRTGAPLATDLLSVSVIAPTAMEADGWATALLVAGLDGGWDLARREALAALFVTARGAGTRRRATPGFDAHWSDGMTSEETRP